MNDFSVIFPYEKAPVWEKYFGIGVNNLVNTGDYYCFPDDELLVKESDKEYRAYLGLLHWTRNVFKSNKEVVISFSRNSQDGVAKRGAKDIMSVEEFNSYNKDQPPLNMQIQHRFNVQKKYSRVDLTFKSESNLKMNIGWFFQDSSVFDFTIGTDVGVESISLRSLKKNQLFFSPTDKDIPIVYRKMSPFKTNMAVFEYACSKEDSLSFLSSSTNDILGYLNNKSEELINKELFAKNDILPHRNHGIGIEFTLQPGQIRKISYFKVFLSDWNQESDLIKLAQEKINEIERVECK